MEGGLGQRVPNHPKAVYGRLSRLGGEVFGLWKAAFIMTGVFEQQARGIMRTAAAFGHGDGGGGEVKAS